MRDFTKHALLAMDSLEYERVHQRMLQLELELIEFQESSKELEQALEDELHDLETQKSSLIAQLLSKDKMISALNFRVIALNSEITEILDSMIENKTIYEKTIADLKHNLVAMEILNDDYLSKDRAVESKLQLANQFNNELLEKLAMVENDLELEKQANAQHRLTISNLGNTKSNQPTRNTRMKRDSTYASFTFAESTILDINEMLATEPPVPVLQSKIPRSESLLRFQELCSKSDLLRQKVEELSSSLAVKSFPTAEVSRPTATSFSSERLSSLVSKGTTSGAAHTFTEGILSREIRNSDSRAFMHGTGTTTDVLQTRESKNIPKGSPELRRKSSRKSKLRTVMRGFLG